MIKYGCGHESEGLLVMNSNPLSMSAYLRWQKTVGIHGSREQCFECFIKKLNKPSEVSLNSSHN